MEGSRKMGRGEERVEQRIKIGGEDSWCKKE